MAHAAIGSLRIVAGGSNVMDAGINLARRARTSLSGEFFILNDEVACAALADAWRSRGLPGSAVITAHPQIIGQASRVAGPGVEVVHYGGLVPDRAPREFIHTKTLARDAHTADPEAWVSTASFGGNARSEWELGALFGGDAARAVHELADSVASRDWQRQRDAIAWARSHGVYVTDPVTRGRGLAEVVETITREEPSRLTVAMKSIFDEQFAQELAARHARDGLPVEVVVERIDAPSERALREAGVRLLKPDPRVPELHANAIVAEGLEQAYFGTMWASPRSFARDRVPNMYTGGGATLPPSQRWDRSREVGIVTSDPQGVRDVREALEMLRPHVHDFRHEVVRPR